MIGVRFVMQDDPHISTSRGQNADDPLSVSQLNWILKQLVETALPRVWLEGEISDLSRPSSGHIYLTLKDDRCQVRAVVWKSTAERLRINLRDGLSVVCSGSVEVYPPRGSYQIVIHQMLPKGIGPLQLAFQELHKKLAELGLFDPQRKKPLPKYPRRIGFVTSPSGAAIHDFLQSAEPLWRDYCLYIIPARVQGEQAAKEIANGIQLAQRISPKLDLLIAGRGGGSLEDLWCFNEEVVVRALANCKIPTVSAVGHEIDVTLSDLAADARAMTPSQAAGLVLAKRSELLGQLDQWRQRIQQAPYNHLRRLKQQLSGLSDRSVLARPHRLHQIKKQQVDELEKRLSGAVQRQLHSRRQSLSELVRAAEALSPLQVLQRGYSLTTLGDSSHTIRSYKQVQVGQRLTTHLSDGIVVSRIESTNDNS